MKRKFQLLLVIVLIISLTPSTISAEDTVTAVYSSELKTGDMYTWTVDPAQVSANATINGDILSNEQPDIVNGSTIDMEVLQDGGMTVPANFSKDEYFSFSVDGTPITSFKTNDSYSISLVASLTVILEYSYSVEISNGNYNVNGIIIPLILPIEYGINGTNANFVDYLYLAAFNATEISTNSDIANFVGIFETLAGDLTYDFDINTKTGLTESATVTVGTHITITVNLSNSVAGNNNNKSNTDTSGLPFGILSLPALFSIVTIRQMYFKIQDTKRWN